MYDSCKYPLPKVGLGKLNVPYLYLSEVSEIWRATWRK